ncbi:MAG: glycosyltransferase family 2 protein [Halothiobacillus sp.]
MKVAVCIPTLNAASLLPSLCLGLTMQKLTLSSVLLIDSSSSDHTAVLAAECGAAVYTIPRSAFNHGGTRQLGVEILEDAEIIVFMTQDAQLADADALGYLLRCFVDPEVGAAYGRQLPHVDARPLGAHARLFNYPETSAVRRFEDRKSLGIKAAFFSNSFSAYRRSALIAVGGFPDDVILGEDMVVAAHMLMAGWRIAYVAEARVRHSHDYSMWEEFRRYFDIGVLHTRESWLLEAFGSPEGEGLRFVKSEFRYLMTRAPYLIPSALVRSALKLAGYRLGRAESKLPRWLKPRLSMHSGFWRA